MDKLEQKLGKLQYQRMQVEAQINTMQKKYDSLLKEMVEIGNQIAELKSKPKKKD